MNILVIGYDGRAFSLIKRLRNSKICSRIVCCPGNSAISDLLQVPCLPIPLDDTANIIQFCQEQHINFVIVTTIETSMAGVVDGLQERDIIVFGPSSSACKLEASKYFGKEISQQRGVSVPEWIAVDTLLDAKRFIKQNTKPFVIKKDGLASGLGVTVCTNVDETLHMLERSFRDDTGRIVLEEYLTGMEVCFTWAVNFQGITPIIVPIVTTMEHKRAYTGNMGPLTAEMGSLSFSGIPKLAQQQILEPLSDYLSASKYTGIFDANCIYDSDKNVLYVLEYTCRFGDPGTEIMLPMMDVDWGEILFSVARGDDASFQYTFHCGIGVVLASGGYPYPNACLQNIPIYVYSEPDIAWFDVMSANTKQQGGWRGLVTRGGRQILILDTNNDMLSAQATVYNRCKQWFHFQEMFYRLDIGDIWLNCNAKQRSLIGVNV